jgi:type I restriction enzyme S subunit
LGEDGAPFLEPEKPKAYVIDGPSWVNNHAHVLRARRELIESLFLKHALNNVDFRPFVTGTTRLKLTQAAMREIPVPVPDLETQRRVVQELEAAQTGVEVTASLVEAVRKRATAVRAAVLSGALRGELVPQDTDDEPASLLLKRIAAERAAAAKPVRERGSKASA